MRYWKDRWQQQAAIGTLISIDSADVAEILALAGFDWLFVDLEHSTFGLDTLKAMLRAAKSARAECAVLARVPLNDEVWLKRVLDTGVDGVIIPQVNTVAEAQNAVKWTKYRPLGQRGVGIGRAQGFGKSLGDTIARANDEVLTIIQAEHGDAVKALDTIVKVKGIDGVFVGPYDLSDSLGVRGEIDNPLVRDAIDSVARICAANNMLSGIFTGNAAAAKTRIAEGFRLIAIGTDGLFLTGAAGEALKTVKS